jgi:pimeloyl-ACP methyl ester carboxylesterase
MRHCCLTRLYDCRTQVWDALPGIQNPVLIMNGEQDVLVPVENARRLAARIPGAQLHTFPGWGHGYKCPAQLAEVVTAFLLQQDSFEVQRAQAPAEEGQAQQE